MPDPAMIRPMPCPSETLSALEQRFTEIRLNGFVQFSVLDPAEHIGRDASWRGIGSVAPRAGAGLNTAV